MQDECHGPGEDGEPVEATKRRADIAGNIDQLHVTKSYLVCPLKPFRSHCNIRDSPAREPAVQQRLIDRSMRPAAAHVLDHAQPTARAQEAPRFSQHQPFIGSMAQTFHSPDHIETGIRKACGGVILLLEGHMVSDTMFLRIALCASNLASY